MGAWVDQFVVDRFQAGAGTSHNMNANEVLANRANELLGGRRGDYRPVHPNDHVNMSQSSNDAVPAMVRLALLRGWERLRPALEGLAEALAAKQREFDGVVKTGRTHLQDAVPIRLGQEFGAYRTTVEKAIDALDQAADWLLATNLGATALGTGIERRSGISPARGGGPPRIDGVGAAAAARLLSGDPESRRFRALLRGPCAGWPWNSRSWPTICGC